MRYDTASSLGWQQRSEPGKARLGGPSLEPRAITSRPHETDEEVKTFSPRYSSRVSLSANGTDSTLMRVVGTGRGGALGAGRVSLYIPYRTEVSNAHMCGDGYRMWSVCGGAATGWGCNRPGSATMCRHPPPPPRDDRHVNPPHQPSLPIATPRTSPRSLLTVGKSILIIFRSPQLRAHCIDCFHVCALFPPPPCLPPGAVPGGWGGGSCPLPPRGPGAE